MDRPILAPHTVPRFPSEPAYTENPNPTIPKLYTLNPIQTQTQVTAAKELEESSGEVSEIESEVRMNRVPVLGFRVWDLGHSYQAVGFQVEVLGFGF